jgi:TonB family protein
MTRSSRFSRWLTLGCVVAAMTLGCARPPAPSDPPAPAPAQPANEPEVTPPAAAPLTGYVIVEFAITEQGTVDSPRVVEAQPEGLFDSAALKAVSKWTYNPKLVDGKPVRREGVRLKLLFKLDP